MTWHKWHPDKINIIIHNIRTAVAQRCDNLQVGIHSHVLNLRWNRGVDLYRLFCSMGKRRIFQHPVCTLRRSPVWTFSASFLLAQFPCTVRPSITWWRVVTNSPSVLISSTPTLTLAPGCPLAPGSLHWHCYKKYVQIVVFGKLEKLS